MPLGATSTTLMSLRNSAPSFFMMPRRKPWLRPRVAPGFIAARMRGYSSACEGVRRVFRGNLSVKSRRP
eukprot:2928754-Pyramimonas_sp.AAC.1